MKRFVYVLLSCLLIVASVCVAGATEVKVTSPGLSVDEALRYDGPKARIAVNDFKCKAAQCQGIGSGLSDMIATALFRSNRFVVLERGEGLKEIQEELKLAQSDYVEEGKGPEKGLMEGADVLLIGAITAFEPDASGGGGSIGGGLLGSVIGGISGSMKNAYIASDLRLVDVRRGRVIDACHVEGEASDWKLGGFGGGIVGDVALGGSLGGYKNTPMEKAIRVMLDAAIQQISQRVPQDYYRYQK